jgi:hypothetical protein
LPDVVHNQDSRLFERGGINLDQMQKVDGRAQLRLVIGTSIGSDGVTKLVRSLAKDVHRAGGAVVYIDRARLPSSRWVGYFDLHLQTDIDTWAADASECLAAVRAPGYDLPSCPTRTRNSIDVGLEVKSLM